MSGLSVSYTGSISRPAEILFDDGEPFLLFGTVADGVRLADEAAASIGVAYFADDAEALAPVLVKNAEVYVEGRLSLLEDKGRTVLSVTASRVEVMGQRGQVIGGIGQARE